MIKSDKLVSLLEFEVAFGVHLVAESEVSQQFLSKLITLTYRRTVMIE